MSSIDDRPDPDDLFAHTRMSLGDHIEELRTAMLTAFKGFIVALILGFFFAEPLLAFIRYPIEKQLTTFHQERQDELHKQYKESQDPKFAKAREPQPFQMQVNPKELGKLLGLKNDLPDERKEVIIWMAPVDVLDATKFNPAFADNSHLITLSITEGFTVWVLVSVYFGIVLSAPWVFYHIWAFVAAGLYPQEKQYVHVFMPMSIGLFLGGAMLCQFLVLPIGVYWLLQFTKWVGVEPVLRLSDWLSFAILMPVMFGVAFQLPLVMFFLYKVGIFTVETYLSQWKMAIFLMTALSTVLAVAPDPLSMLGLAVPMWGLYFFGIGLCKMWPNPVFEEDESETKELIEV